MVAPEKLGVWTDCCAVLRAAAEDCASTSSTTCWVAVKPNTTRNRLRPWFTQQLILKTNNLPPFEFAKRSGKDQVQCILARSKPHELAVPARPGGASLDCHDPVLTYGRHKRPILLRRRPKRCHFRHTGLRHRRREPCRLGLRFRAHRTMTGNRRPSSSRWRCSSVGCLNGNFASQQPPVSARANKAKHDVSEQDRHFIGAPDRPAPGYNRKVQPIQDNPD